MKRLTVEIPSELYKDLKIYSFTNGLKLKETLSISLKAFLQKGFLEEKTLRECLRDIFGEK